MMRIIEPLSLLLVATNALFLVGIVGALALRWSTWTAPVALPTEHLRSGPEHHLPLDGMDGMRYPPEEACLRLNGFLMEMARELGGGLPVTMEQIRAVVDSGRCSIEDAAVQDILVAYRAAYQAAGLEPLSPFALVD